MRAAIARFDMYDANMVPVLNLSPQEHRELRKFGELPPDNSLHVLVVPGLQEGRPAIFKTDRVYIRPAARPWDLWICCAVHISFNKLVLKLPDGADTGWPVRVHVRFQVDVDKLTAMRDACIGLWDFRTQLLPRPVPKVVPARDWFLSLDTEQAKSAGSFLDAAPGSVQLLLGPPGTGKSFTLVEIMLQALHCGVRLYRQTAEVKRIRIEYASNSNAYLLAKIGVDTAENEPIE